MLAALPFHQAGVSPHQMSLAYGSSNGKGESSTPSIEGHFLGTPTLVSTHGDCQGIWGLTTGSLMEKVGACSKQYLDLGIPSSYLQWPSSSPNL